MNETTETDAYKNSLLHDAHLLLRNALRRHGGLSVNTVQEIRAHGRTLLGVEDETDWRTETMAFVAGLLSDEVEEDRSLRQQQRGSWLGTDETPGVL